MTVTQQIQSKINNMPLGRVFTYSMMGIANAQMSAATKSIQRLLEKNEIARISRGKFYKPEKSIFGETTPNSNEILKSYLYKNNKRVAYETGNSLYNKLGLTTQLSKYITLGVYQSRITVDKNLLKIKSVKSYVNPTDTNIGYLQFLDIIKDFNSIPDMDADYTIAFLAKRLKDLDSLILIKYALKYPPRVVALLGALMEMNQIDTGRLINKLNPISNYDFNINPNILPTASNWNIQ